MNKHNILFIFCILGATYGLKAQDCTFYFPQKPGTTLEMKHYNAKDKLTATTQTKIIEKSATSIKFTSEFSDEKDKKVHTGTYEVHCKNGEFTMDMSSFTQGMNLDAYKDMEIKFETDEMSFPSMLQPGMKLNDGEVRIKIANQGMTLMNMSMKIYNRVVEGKEDITTPAGTFSCYKITYDVDSKVLFKSQSKGVEWISKNAGIVRTESRDTKGKMVAYSVLSQLKD